MQTQSTVSQFINNRSGQFGIMFAIVLLPLLASVGFAVDYTSMVQTASRLRDSSDAAAFYAATELKKTGDLPSNTQVADFIAGNFAKTDSEFEPKLVSLTVVNGDLILNTNVKKPLAIMGIFDHADPFIAAQSVVTIGTDEDIEVVLVLDTTRSMLALSGSSSSDLDPTGEFFPNLVPNLTRIDALKFSAKRFTDTIYGGDAGKRKTRMAVVPFAKYVNVGTDKRGASWLTVPDDTAATEILCDNVAPVIGTENCQLKTIIEDGVELSFTSCTNIYGPPVQVCQPWGASTWHGCVGSRNAPLNVQDGSPSAKFTGIMNEQCTQPIQPLTLNKPAILTSINNLGVYGTTYIPEGVMWGQRVLSTGVPYTEVRAATSTQKVRRIMVMMTDGDNQAVANIPTSATHKGIDAKQPDFLENRSKTDAFTLDACKSAKDSGIEVYTISFGDDLTAQSEKIIKSCASDPKNYFSAKDAEALNAAFMTIAATIGGMRLSG